MDIEVTRIVVEGRSIPFKRAKLTRVFGWNVEIWGPPQGVFDRVRSVPLELIANGLHLTGLARVMEPDRGGSALSPSPVPVVLRIAGELLQAG
jgi:hypothetical protein